MIDSHAHILAEQFDSDREALISSAKDIGLAWVEVGTDVEGSKRAVDLAQQHANIFATVGVHPDDILHIQEDDWDMLESLAQNSKTCAIGEVGFDFSRLVIPASEPESTWIPGQARDDELADAIEFQEVILRKFIALAQKTNKPIIFHVRSKSASSAFAGKTLEANPPLRRASAHAELIRVLRDYSDIDRPKGVIHTFSGTQEQAQQYVALGMMISFSGVVTFKNAGELREIAKHIPLESLLVETDCPFLTPEPFRGKRNEPIFVRYVIERIAELRGVSFEEISEATERNAKKLFALDK